MDVTELWRPLIPNSNNRSHIIGCIAVALGYREKRLIAKKAASGEESMDDEISDDNDC